MKSPVIIIFLSAIFTTCVFLGVYSSCTKDGCKGVTCLNGGACHGGVCHCPTGMGGNNCEIVYRNAYIHTYKGNGTCDTLNADSTHTVRVALSYNASTLTFDTTGTTSLVNMNMGFRDSSGKVSIMYSITLDSTSASASGSNFTIQPTLVNGFHFSGYGTVSSTVATFNLTASADTSLHATRDSAITVTYSFPGYIRQ